MFSWYTMIVCWIVPSPSPSSPWASAGLVMPTPAPRTIARTRCERLMPAGAGSGAGPAGRNRNVVKHQVVDLQHRLAAQLNLAQRQNAQGRARRREGGDGGAVQPDVGRRQLRDVVPQHQLALRADVEADDPAAARGLIGHQGEPGGLRLDVEVAAVVEVLIAAAQLLEGVGHPVEGRAFGRVSAGMHGRALNAEPAAAGPAVHRAAFKAIAEERCAP